MEIDDHFDPLDFYSNDGSDQVPSADMTAVNKNTENNFIINNNISSVSKSQTKVQVQASNANLRRSGRPKPAAESLISSPPAIKFYESTVIRKTSKSSSTTTTTASRSSEKDKVFREGGASSVDGSPVANSKVLKLRLAGSDSADSTAAAALSIKENTLEILKAKRYKIPPKIIFISYFFSNLRVVKLMMPDITEDDRSHNHHSHTSKSPVKNIKILPLLAPKPATREINQIIHSKDFKLRERTAKRKGKEENNRDKEEKVKVKVEIGSKEFEDIGNSKKVKKRKNNENYVETTAVSTEKSIDNSVVKLSLAISANAPKSEPLSHSHSSHNNIINEDVCSSCGGLGNFICCDACPRSFHFTCAEPPLDPQNLPEDDWYCNECRYHLRKKKGESQSSTESSSGDIWELMIGRAEVMNPKCFVMPRRFRYQPKEEDLIKLQSGQLFKQTDIIPSHISLLPPVLVEPTHIMINNLVKIDHCGYELVAPNISSAKSPSGYCHCCGRFGLTKEALGKTEEFLNIPNDAQYHRPIMSCSICPLYWHLDCLETPMVSFPPPSVTWTCPIHFTSEQCVALDVAESLVQAATLLPESAVRLQFSRKVERIKTGDVTDDLSDEYEAIYGVTNCIDVPENIKSTYQ
jgi:hypothetical protein